MNVRELVDKFDYEVADCHALAVLLEQVFAYHDSFSERGGSLLVASNILQEFESVIREKSAPEFRSKVRDRLSELRYSVRELEHHISELEKEGLLNR